MIVVGNIVKESTVKHVVTSKAKSESLSEWGQKQKQFFLMNGKQTKLQRIY